MKKHTGVIILAAVLAGSVFTGCGTEESINIRIAEEPAVTNAVITEAVTEADTAADTEEAAETEIPAETPASSETEVTDEESEEETSETEVSETEEVTEDETAADPSAASAQGFSRVTKNPRAGSAGPVVSELEGRWEDGEGNVIEFKNCSDYAGDFVMVSSEGMTVTGKAYVEYNFNTDNYAVF